MVYCVGAKVGNYEILAPLGAGAFGDVFKVRQVLTGRIEAIKVLHPGRADSPQEKERFLREIQLQASLQHRNIAAVYNAYLAEDRLVMVMEFVEGRNLRQIMESGPVDLPFTLEVAAQALSALEHAHANGMIHRDIKPENILVTSNGVAKLTDFGLAKSSMAGTFTNSAAPMGSLSYISPEQVRAVKEIDGHTDLYSLGAVLYELLTGQPPFGTGSAYELMKAHVETMPLPPIERNPEIPPLLSDAVVTALRKNPGQRFSSAAEFRRVLEKVPRRTSVSVRCRTAVPSTRTRKWLSRRVVAALAGILLGIGFAATVGLSRWPSKQEIPALESPPIAFGIRPPGFAYQRTPTLPEPEPTAATQITSAPAPRRQRKAPRKSAQSPAAPVSEPKAETEPTEAAAALKPPAETIRTKTAAPPAQVIPGAPPRPALTALVTLPAGDGTKALAFGPRGTVLATFGGARVTIWDLATGAKRVAFGSAGDRVAALAFSPDAEEIFTGNGDGTVRIWNLIEQREITTLGFEAGVTALAIQPSGELLIVGLRDKSVRIWHKDPATGQYKKAYRPLKGGKQPPVALAYNAQANLLAAATAGNHLPLWRAFGGKPARIPALDGGASALAIRSSGDLMAAAGPGRLALLYLPTRKQVHTLATGAQLHALAFLAAGRCLAAAAGGRTVRLWDVTSSTPVVEAVAPALIRAVCLSRDGKRVAVLDSGGKVSVWRLNETAVSLVTQPLTDKEVQALVDTAGKESAHPPAKKNLFRRLLNAVKK